MSDEKLTDDKMNAWKQQSKELIETIFLRHPDTENEMVVISDILDNGDGTFSFIVTEDPEGDEGFQFLVGMAAVKKGDVEPINMSEPEKKSNIVTLDNPAGKLVGLDGQPLV